MSLRTSPRQQGFRAQRPSSSVTRCDKPHCFQVLAACHKYSNNIVVAGMAGLPPKPDDVLPPLNSRGKTSPRAASMRSDRDRDRDDRRRRSPDSRRYSPPRSEGRRRPVRGDERYQDQLPRSARDRDERDHPRPRGGGLGTHHSQTGLCIH
jgi:hypothetical protein